MEPKTQTLVIIDYGSQYTQLIARRARELGVFSCIVPYTISIAEIRKLEPAGIVLSGGPNSVYDKRAPRVHKHIFDLGVPVLGICYGLQLIAKHFGGAVEASTTREYGNAKLALSGKRSDLLDSVRNNSTVWMSHGDHVAKPPKGFTVTAMSGDTIVAIENSKDYIFGLQFHPEVSHSRQGKTILQNFLNICGFRGDWKSRAVIDSQVTIIKETVGSHNVICALSGGVDSTVAATLVHRAVGDQQTCIFVDNGLLRQNEYEEVLAIYKTMGLNVKPIRAASRFLTKLIGVNDPEKKRKIIGREFIAVFEEESKKIHDVKFLVQGTLYADVIESVSVGGASVKIKSHHNVGGLPKRMKLSLIEPLRDLFKDEVRSIGKDLGLPTSITQRQPFPGPGLGVRILGDVTRARVKLLQQADAIVRAEIEASRERKNVDQFFAVLLPIKSVGVMGDNRTYENVIAVRAVETNDIMTADWAKLPHKLLAKISSRIVSEVTGINRVVYDITSKPPGTIEWE